jgi:pyruvate ferredoxin oxidoreductase gamma subunit
MKTASRILGSALFAQGYEVQDAPRYGAERRGAPIFAYVRADHQPISERGIIRRPDLVVVADDTLVPVPAAGVLSGIDAHTLLLIRSQTSAETWRKRLNTAAGILTLPADEETADRAELSFVGAACAGAAARLLGVVSQAALIQGLRQELGMHDQSVVHRNEDNAMAAYQRLADHSGLVGEGPEMDAGSYVSPGWVSLPFEQARVSAPVIYGSCTSELVETGLWRTLRPVIDYDRCKRCWWVCSSLCPDGAISVTESQPSIDYDHCKGCMVCVAVCPPHAIEAQAERGQAPPERGL